MYQIILASGSPRRKEIMETMDIPYQVITADVKEETEETVPAKKVQALASLKANAVLPRVRKLAKEAEQSENRRSSS
jgi:septum formation protein